MKTVFLILSCFVFNIQWCVLCCAVEPKADAVVDDTPEVSAVDIASLRNPFLSLLPKKEIVKTLVEPFVPKIDNANNRLPSYTMPPAMLPVSQTPTVVVTENVSQRSLPALRVQGIIWGGDRPQAIINDRIVELGDDVEGATIKSIQKDGVNVLFDGKIAHVAIQQ